MTAAIVIIVAGIVVVVAAGAVISAVAKVKDVVEPVIHLAKYVDVEAQELEYETNPKSVNAMTSVYLPTIEKDFPQFNYYEFKDKAENMIKSAFLAISTEDESSLINASDDLLSQIQLRISANRTNHLKESFKDITIHRTEIKHYRKSAGNCVITLQSSVGYYHYMTDASGEIVKGSREHMEQTRYDTELLYIQDVTKTEKGETMLSNNCPNCGAPIKAVGTKTCPYCGSGVEDINIRAWSINKLTEC